jgi:hypothetical protein
MNPGWRILELLPKRMKWNEWPQEHLFGWYIPNAEPRLVRHDQAKPPIHQSVFEKQDRVPGYHPVNLPSKYETEPWKDLAPWEVETAGTTSPSTVMAQGQLESMH